MIVLGMLLVPFGVGLILSAGWGVLVGGLLALGFGIDAARDEVPTARAAMDPPEMVWTPEDLRLVGAEAS
jgi:hypothetical protein